ncbi:MAG: hypothetical protein Q9202_000581 [Teloschistes flavicans]
MSFHDALAREEDQEPVCPGRGRRLYAITDGEDDEVDKEEEDEEERAIGAVKEHRRPVVAAKGRLRKKLLTKKVTDRVSHGRVTRHMTRLRRRIARFAAASIIAAHTASSSPVNRGLRDYRLWVPENRAGERLITRFLEVTRAHYCIRQPSAGEPAPQTDTTQSYLMQWRDLQNQFVQAGGTGLLPRLSETEEKPWFWDHANQNLWEFMGFGPWRW